MTPTELLNSGAPAIDAARAARRLTLRESIERQCERDESDRLYDDLTSGKPDSALLEGAWAEFQRILEIADDQVRNDLIEDTSLSSLLRMVADRRAKAASDRGDLGEEFATAMEEAQEGEFDRAWDAAKDARLEGRKP